MIKLFLTYRLYKNSLSTTIRALNSGLDYILSELFLLLVLVFVIAKGYFVSLCFLLLTTFHLSILNPGQWGWFSHFSCLFIFFNYWNIIWLLSLKIINLYFFVFTILFLLIFLLILDLYTILHNTWTPIILTFLLNFLKSLTLKPRYLRKPKRLIHSWISKSSFNFFLKAPQLLLNIPIYICKPFSRIILVHFPSFFISKRRLHSWIKSFFCCSFWTSAPFFTFLRQIF